MCPLACCLCGPLEAKSLYSLSIPLLEPCSVVTELRCSLKVLWLATHQVLAPPALALTVLYWKYPTFLLSEVAKHSKQKNIIVNENFSHPALISSYTCSIRWASPRLIQCEHSCSKCIPNWHIEHAMGGKLCDGCPKLWTEFKSWLFLSFVLVFKIIGSPYFLTYMNSSTKNMQGVR